MFPPVVHPTMYDGKSITAITKLIWKKYHANRKLDDNLIEECDDYVMDEAEDEEGDTEFYFDEIIEKFSDNNEVFLEDSIFYLFQGFKA